MARYNLERFNVILVEDNRFVRNILEDMLRHFRIGRVASCTNGQEAIEYLKTMKSMVQAGASTPLDILISDLVMSPINGLLLLRWVRTAKDSPNRFVPFVMFSGAADAEYVNASRDLGVTEFLAKPFSAESVYMRLLEVIDYPRQFAATQKYFGPDRRRKGSSAPNGKERRVITDADATIVYSSDKIAKPKSPSEVWLFRPPNRLKEKAGGFGLGKDEGGEIPMDLLEQAEEKLHRAALDFTEWALGYLSKLSDLCTEALLKPDRRDHYFAEINELAHELRGQGGTFGYPLVSMFGKSLYDVTGEGCREDDNAVEIVKAHIDAMRAVIREKIEGDGGGIGRDLMKHLKEAINKYSTIT